MKQIFLSSSGFELKAQRTRKREFLGAMGLVVPWAELGALIQPHAPKVGTNSGCPPLAVTTMLRIHFLLKKNTQQLYALFAMPNL